MRILPCRVVNVSRLVADSAAHFALKKLGLIDNAELSNSLTAPEMVQRLQVP